MKPLKQSTLTFAFIVCILLSCSTQEKQNEVIINEDSLAAVFDISLKKGILDAWYPRVIDSAAGGYYSNLAYDWKVMSDQPKMLVSQTRQVWTSSQAALFYHDTLYTKYARHGFLFLKDHMWDKMYGGFFNLRSRNGGYPNESYRDEKRAYGNSFAIYALVSYYQLTHDTMALEYAKWTFLWLEKFSHDKRYGGYMDPLDRDGTWLMKVKPSKKRPDAPVNHWKDYNSSIHLLESFTELYRVWPDSLVRTRLQEMLTLVRDTFAGRKGYLTLYFSLDWKPVSYRDSGTQTILRYKEFDHVSFGHDIETAYLMLKASHALGIPHDTLTLCIARSLVDHALGTGFNRKHGGFFYEGYYFPGRDTLTIIDREKSWWVEAEGLNSLLLMSKIFPSDKQYPEAFLKQWQEVDSFLIDKKHGGWYISGLEENPEARTAPKASVWKANYHDSRALMNCIRLLRNENEVAGSFKPLADEISH